MLPKIFLLHLRLRFIPVHDQLTDHRTDLNEIQTNIFPMTIKYYIDLGDIIGKV